MRISPIFPVPLQGLLILGIGCVVAGLELSEPVATPVGRQQTQTVAAEQQATPLNPAPSMTSRIRTGSAAAPQNAAHMAESAPRKPQDRR